MALADAPRCTAKAKSTGKRCHNPAVSTYNVCHLHGGKTPRGLNAPAFRHGRYSRTMPAGLLERYQEALQDEELKDQRASIALIDTLINGMLPDLNTDNPEQASSLRKQILKALESRRVHIETENRLALAGQRALSVEQFMTLMSQILHIIQKVVIDPQQRFAIAGTHYVGKWWGRCPYPAADCPDFETEIRRVRRN